MSPFSMNTYYKVEPVKSAYESIYEKQLRFYRELIDEENSYKVNCKIKELETVIEGQFRVLAAAYHEMKRQLRGILK